MNVEFITSAAEPGQFPRHPLPEVAFAGRSNVGKSSLINRLAGRARVARVSKNPGCTKTLNFFAVERRLCLVDLPGYGFARVSHEEREAWRDAIDEYLQERDNLAGVAVVVDASTPPSDLDVEMIGYACTLGAPVIAVATKVDRLAKHKRSQALAALSRAFGGGPAVHGKRVLSSDPAGGGTRVERRALCGPGAVLPFSAETGEGRRELLGWITDTCGTARLA